MKKLLSDPIRDPFDPPLADAQRYHEGTKITQVSNLTLGRRVSAANDPAYHSTMARAWKSYDAEQPISLARPPSLGAMTLAQAIAAAPPPAGPVTIEQLGAILRFSYGPTQLKPMAGNPRETVYNRATPSAGALYPLELYPIIFNVAGCEPGIYHYGITEHTLEAVRLGREQAGGLLDALTPRARPNRAAAWVAITGVFPRVLSKYLFRGYRFMTCEVGALMQNLSLTSRAVGVRAGLAGGFYDDEVAHLLGIDGVEENVLVLFSFGDDEEGEDVFGF
jgi:SagB-type dehydrogenase family enzyme